MSKAPGKVTRPQSRLESINEQISELISREPWGGIYATFSMAAHIAKEAIERAEELSRLPGSNHAELKLVLDFWYRTRDCNHVAGLVLAGG